MDTLRGVQQDIARVSNIIASAEYVVNALASEVQTAIGSALNYLDYPTAFIGDLKHLTGAFTDRLSLSEASRLSDWNALLNPSLRKSNNLNPGDVLYAWAR